MCKPASMILTKDRAFWSLLTDSHEDIIAEFALHADGARGPNIVRVEITPPDSRMDMPLDQWTYQVDQDTLPDWYDAADGEARTRAALVEYAAARVFADSHKHIVTNASCWAYKSSSVVARGSSRVEAWGSSRVEAWESSLIRILKISSQVVKLAAKTAAIVVQIGDTAARLVSEWPENK